MNDRVHASKRLLRLEMSFQLFDYTDEIYKSTASWIWRNPRGQGVDWLDPRIGPLIRIRKLYTLEKYSGNVHTHA